MNLEDQVRRGVTAMRQYEELALLPPLQRLLAGGEPVTVEQHAEAGGWSVDVVRAGLHGSRASSGTRRAESWGSG